MPLSVGVSLLTRPLSFQSHRRTSTGDVSFFDSEPRRLRLKSIKKMKMEAALGRGLKVEGKWFVSIGFSWFVATVELNTRWDTGRLYATSLRLIFIFIISLFHHFIISLFQIFQFFSFFSFFHYFIISVISFFHTFEFLIFFFEFLIFF